MGIKERLQKLASDEEQRRADIQEKKKQQELSRVERDRQTLSIGWENERGVQVVETIKIACSLGLYDLLHEINEDALGGKGEIGFGLHLDDNNKSQIGLDLGLDECFLPVPSSSRVEFDRNRVDGIPFDFNDVRGVSLRLSWGYYSVSSREGYFHDGQLIDGGVSRGGRDLYFILNLNDHSLNIRVSKWNIPGVLKRFSQKFNKEQWLSSLKGVRNATAAGLFRIGVR